jgi:hypothetical protein
MPAKKTKRDFGAMAQYAADTDTKKLDHPDDIKKRKPKVSAGRTPTVDYDRSGKLHISITQDTFDRLDEALLGERKKRRPDKVDKGLIVEEALTAWLKKHKY